MANFNIPLYVQSGYLRRGMCTLDNVFVYSLSLALAVQRSVRRRSNLSVCFRVG